MLDPIQFIAIGIGGSTLVLMEEGIIYVPTIPDNTPIATYQEIQDRISLIKLNQLL